MAGSYTWLGSLNVDSFVSQQLQTETANLQVYKQNQEAPLLSVQTQLQAQSQYYSNVDGLFQTLSGDITSLNNTFNPTPQISTSNPNLVTATQIAGQTLNSGTHTVHVNNLAAATTYASTLTEASASTTIGSSGNLQIQVGSANFGVAVSSSDTLQTIANNINSAAATNKANVSASVVQSSSGNYQLVINSTQTGTANAVTVTDTTSGPNLGMTVSQAAADASFSFDGINMTNASNTNIAVGALDINLLGAGQTAAITVTSSSPIGQVISSVQTVVNDYNNLMTELSKDQITGESDPALSTIQMALQNLMQNQSLVNLGISVQDPSLVPTISVTLADGSTHPMTPAGILTVDTGMLTTQLSNNYAAVATTLTDPTNGILTGKGTTNGANVGVQSAITGPTGSIYSILHDPTYGAESGQHGVGAQLTKIAQQLSSIDTEYQMQAKDLKVKFGALDGSLGALQLQSQALSQMLASLG